MNSKIVFLLSVCFSATLAYDDVTLVEYISTHSFLYFDNLIRQSGLTDILSQTGNILLRFSMTSTLKLLPSFLPYVQ